MSPLGRLPRARHRRLSTDKTFVGLRPEAPKEPRRAKCRGSFFRSHRRGPGHHHIDIVASAFPKTPSAYALSENGL